jgi:hypothetical protein
MGHVPGRAVADHGYPGPTARPYKFRRVTVAAMVLALVEVVTLVAGCLSRPAPALVALRLGGPSRLSRTP